LGPSAFSTFGGLLPLIAGLLALPQKDLLQGLGLQTEKSEKFNLAKTINYYFGG
jgi:hypothetical protein